MIHKRALLSILAVIPLALGLNLLTGQNFFHFRRFNESEAALWGILLELAAFRLVYLSKARIAIHLACYLFILQSPLFIGWGLVVGMFSGVGAGVSRGPSIFDVLIWIVNGGISASIGIFVLIHQFKKRNPRRLCEKCGILAGWAPRGMQGPQRREYSARCLFEDQ